MDTRVHVMQVTRVQTVKQTSMNVHRCRVLPVLLVSSTCFLFSFCVYVQTDVVMPC